MGGAPSGEPRPPDDRVVGWLWVVLAAVLLAVAAAGVNALAHGGLDSAAKWTFTSESLRFVFAAVGLVAFVVVVSGLLWLMNPTLAALNQTRARITVFGAMLVGAGLLGFVLIFRSGPAKPKLPGPSPSSSGPRISGSPDAPGLFGTPDWVGPALITIAIAAVLAGAALLLLNRMRRRDRLAAAPISPAVPPLAMAALAGRDAVLAGDMSPRAAIIRCFGAMENALASHQDASPRVSDTPGEVLRRGWQAGLIRREPADRLLELFAVARFSDHPMGEPDRTSAADALSEMLDDLQERAR
ncbi:DUF4129 domain-containing protein [Fodinicola feengrottensis]|uniref:Protein-glutamine gamma-glutamyltransferase-like C-terminal domain-containing protein n=1 Tax=Fodinicola feengrottensis TaxID=435914 RepID=A0ABN2HA96_9ACTN|nr:DUF4129 domain-containing protein [Fodinicola feengrottensis]